MQVAAFGVGSGFSFGAPVALALVLWCDLLVFETVLAVCSLTIEDRRKRNVAGSAVWIGLIFGLAFAGFEDVSDLIRDNV